MHQSRTDESKDVVVKDDVPSINNYSIIGPADIDKPFLLEGW